MMRSLTTLLLLSAISYAQAQTTIGSWVFVPRIDKMTDANRNMAYTDGIDNKDATLYIRCMEDGLNIMFDPDDYLDSDSNLMYWRFDKKPMFGPFDYDPSTDGDSAFLPIKLVSRFIENAKISNQVVLRAIDYNGSSHTATFKLSGISDVAKKLGCK